MNCPKCNVALSMTDRQGVEIDFCPQCRGIWLDRGELDKIIERAGSAIAPPLPPLPLIHPALCRPCHPRSAITAAGMMTMTTTIPTVAPMAATIPAERKRKAFWASFLTSDKPGADNAWPIQSKQQTK